MVLLASLFNSFDVFTGPLCFVILLMFMSGVVRKYKDDTQRKIFLQAFYFKMLCTLIYTLLMTFYYAGGDTEMYYECTVDLHNAVMDDSNNFVKIWSSK